jgi:catechol 2,3-dioxygenase-like lactoylglutathione lyase family enzyme
MIIDVFHFSFTVSDVDAASDWLERVLGLELVLRQRQDNDYTRKLVGIDGAILEIAQFAIPGISPLRSTHMLEIVEYVTPKGHRPCELPTNNAGVAHLALMVTDVHARYERMRSQGVEFVNPPVQITAGANRGGWSCYLRGPDGITFELMQPSPARLEALGLTA